MKFEDVEFQGKEKFKFSAVKEITDILEHNLTLERLSYLAIVRYVEVLLDDQDFNVRSKVFYDKVTNKKLSCNFLAGIAHDFILDHKEDFEI